MERDAGVISAVVGWVVGGLVVCIISPINSPSSTNQNAIFYKQAAMSNFWWLTCQHKGYPKTCNVFHLPNNFLRMSWLPGKFNRMQLSDESAHCNFSRCEVKCELVCLVKNKTSERQRGRGERQSQSEADCRETFQTYLHLYIQTGRHILQWEFAHPHSCQYSKCVALVSRLTIASSKLSNASLHSLNAGVTWCYFAPSLSIHAKYLQQGW